MIDFTKRSDEIVEIRDDNDAKAVLIKLGVLDKFSKRSPLAGEWTETIHVTDHPTHWIIANLFTGFPVAADNGYLLRCFPKSRVSAEKMKAMAATDLAMNHSAGIAEVRFPPKKTSPEN